MSNKKETKRVDLVTEKIKEVIWQLMNLIRSGDPDFDSKTYFIIVYCAYVATLNGIDNVDDLLTHFESKESERRATFVSSIGRSKMEIVFHLTKKFSADDFRDYMYVCPKEDKKINMASFSTPESISKLVLSILDVKSGESVADFGCGQGDFLTLAAEQVKASPLYGIEINTNASEISEIRMELFSNKATIELGDMFALSKDKKFDKIFLNPPSVHNLTRKGEEYLDLLRRESPEIDMLRSSDWIFNCLLLDHLTDEGKAIAVTINRGAWSQSDREIRKYFINNGFIEAVIALPPVLFTNMYVSTTLTVLSRGNKSIRIIDATNFPRRDKIGRRINPLSDSSVDRIVKLMTEDGEHAASVDLKKLQENNYALYPPRYLNAFKIEAGVEFGSLITRVTRGTKLMGGKLAELTSDVPTNTRYLNVTNIQNGTISGDLPYLKPLDSKLDKYCVGNRNLIISKNGSPFKVAVAEVEDGKKVLGSDNLYIVELDESKVNPYFLKAFFDSEIGTMALASIATGNALPIISIESLKKLNVPLPSMKVQNDIANLYQAKMDEIKILQSRLQKAQNELREIFQEVD